MSAEEISQALREYESVLAEHGAAVVRRLRPGISRDKALAIAQRHGFHMSEEALAMWMWHDGDEEGPKLDNGWCGQPGIVAWYSFPCLEASLTIMEETYGSQLGPKPDETTTEWPDRRCIIPFAYHTCYTVYSFFCPPDEETDIFYGERYDRPHPAVDVIRSWTEAVRSGMWRVYPDGQLRSDQLWGSSDSQHKREA